MQWHTGSVLNLFARIGVLNLFARIGVLNLFARIGSIDVPYSSAYTFRTKRQIKQ
jgi:hypothetical protein